MTPPTSSPVLKVGFGGPPKSVEFKKLEPGSNPSRIVMTVDGEGKEGKTHFALTAPGPIGYINLDLGHEGVIEPFARQKDIYPFLFHIPLSASLPGSPFTAMSDEARKVWEEMVRTFRACLDQMRTVVLDTGTEAWNVLRLARLGKLTQVMPVQYTAVNAEFRQLTQLALVQTKCNVIYTHKMKAVYENEQKTQKTERAGFGDITYDVQAVVRTGRDSAREGAEQFSLCMEECRANPTATGREFRGVHATFQDVAKAIYPTSDEGTWLT